MSTPTPIPTPPPSKLSTDESLVKAWFAQWPPWIAAAIGFAVGFLVAKVL